MSKKLKQTYFQEDWLTDKEFSEWVARAENDKEARCTLCKSNIKLSNMGVTALRSHVKSSKKHAERVKEKHQIQNCFTKHKKVDTQTNSKHENHGSKEVLEVDESVPGSSSSTKQSTIPASFQDAGKINAEIRWALKHALSGYSDNSVIDTTDLFKVIFPNSKVPSLMELGKTKLMYVCNYGIAPHFKNLLRDEISKSPWYSISFDESLNKVVQESEMNLLVRYWDVNRNSVRCRYWESVFLGHTSAVDLLDSYNTGLSGFDFSKQVQISMDGPNVNWKFLSLVEKERDEAELSKPLNIGSCNLHIVHNAFQVGTEATEWKLKAILKASFQILKDSPARPEDFVSITGSKIFPLPFCATRYFVVL